MENDYLSEFSNELNSSEVLIWSGRTNKHKQEFYALT